MTHLASSYNDSTNKRIPVIAVVIPCYRVKRHILSVINSLGPECGAIIVVDDKCPEQTGRYVEEACTDPRVRVFYNERNLGVGGATLSGYKLALEMGCDIMVKVDGDGQMDASLIPALVAPIVERDADFAKGNRFFYPESLGKMPLVRVLGNSLLSFMSKMSSGYWHIYDPTNGFTAIQASVARMLPFDRIAKGFFFESDMLYRLSIIRCTVVDIPHHARYGDEESNLRILGIIPRFLKGHLRNAVSRVVLQYFLRDFSIASLELLASAALILFGFFFGAFSWISSVMSGVPASSGTVMLASLPCIVGFQCLLGFLSYDIQNEPRIPLQRLLRARIAKEGILSRNVESFAEAQDSRCGTTRIP